MGYILLNRFVAESTAGAPKQAMAGDWAYHHDGYLAIVWMVGESYQNLMSHATNS